MQAASEAGDAARQNAICVLLHCILIHDYDGFEIGTYLKTWVTTMESRNLKTKTAYRPYARLEVFYTGGPLCVSGSAVLACACSDEVKV